ncbi:Hpt domain-containing protein [Deminuibacter soli]|uniref:Hpt domain-containing protein n=1 Tax=Deminuibacter soli TaxID=2291815 RepID=A0A3E1NND7_9BACT|nr:Hpt domain-containing protein [Deminuibacter soli]RFM29441.1 Hpt domain-containing protein [Deminuibacter soli]
MNMTHYASQPENNNRLYDLTLVKEIARGNMDFIKSLCQVFITSAPINLAEMKTTAAAGDWDRVARLAHKLKSTIDTMHIEEARRLVREIENSARDQQQTNTIDGNISRIETLVAIATSQLKEDFHL